VFVRVLKLAHTTIDVLKGPFTKGYSTQLGLCNSLTVEPTAIVQNSHQKTKGKAIIFFTGACMCVSYTHAIKTTFKNF